MWKWIKGHVLEIYIGALLLCGSVVGGYLTLVNWIPLGDREKDLQKAFAGVQIFIMCVALALIMFLTKVLLDALFSWGEKRYGNYENYVNPENFPKTEERTIQSILTTMTQKPWLLVWDILQGCGLFAGVIASLSCFEDADINKLALAGGILKMAVYAVGVHFLILLYYKKRDYTPKLIKNTEKYFHIVNRESFLAHLEKDLQDHMLVYSKMWILTQDYILGWSETEVAFHPVAIPRNEILRIQFRVSDKWFGHGKRSIAPVIICELQNGKTVEIFAGNRFQIGVVQQLLQRFEEDKLFYHQGRE